MEIIDEKEIAISEDIFVQDGLMEEKEEERYLGDIISQDGRNIKNIKARISKGKGIVTKIMSILDSIPFGNKFFKVAIILRNSLLTSSMLCNSEAWYNLTKAELNLLETIDVMLLRKVLKAPMSTPIEMLYLELGCIPYRQLIQKRRMLFLFYILHQKPESMIYKFFQTQLKNRNPKDWVTTVLKDIKELELNIELEDIQTMNKSSYTNMIKKIIGEKTLKELEKRKSQHSKVRNIKHSSLRMQKYLQPNKLLIKNEESQLIFKLRCRVTEAKFNFKGIYDTYECDLCGKEDENQEHILLCSELIKRNKEIDEIPEYSKLFDGKIDDQLKIAKVFQQNMNLKQKLLKS